MDKSFLDITGFADVFSRFWRQKNPAGLRRFAKKSDPFRKPASGFSCPKGCEGRYCMQSIPLAVLKLNIKRHVKEGGSHCMQSIPLAVLKLVLIYHFWGYFLLHAIHTACGIETNADRCRAKSVPRQLHAIHTACGIETLSDRFENLARHNCMQSIPLAVLKQKERVLRLSPFAVPAFLCNIYKKAAQVSDDACAAFCISLTMFPSP